MVLSSLVMDLVEELDSVDDLRQDGLWCRKLARVKSQVKKVDLEQEGLIIDDR